MAAAVSSPGRSATTNGGDGAHDGHVGGRRADVLARNETATEAVHGPSEGTEGRLGLWLAFARENHGLRATCWEPHQRKLEAHRAREAERVAQREA